MRNPLIKDAELLTDEAGGCNTYTAFAEERCLPPPTAAMTYSLDDSAEQTASYYHMDM
jgi:hypothetical protein